LAIDLSMGNLSTMTWGGGVLGIESVHLSAGQRLDFSAHKFGLDLVGYASWEPNDLEIPFQMRNVRYFYDNPQGTNSFHTAFEQAALFGSGENLIVPVNLASEISVLELVNTKDHSTLVDVTLRAANGAPQAFLSYELAPHASRHIIVNEYLKALLGVALIKSDTTGGIIAYVSQYSHRVDGTLNYAYSIPAKEAIGAVLQGSYNTYLGQHSKLLIANLSEQPQVVNFSINRSSGQSILRGKELLLEANEIRMLTLNEYEQADNYGTVTLQGENPGTLIAWILREKEGNFVIPVSMDTM